jgi:glycosyltransferase involved in cell wall biosynthesis
MINDALTRIGNIVRIRNVTELLTGIPQGTQIIWHYGDLKLVDQHIEAARQADLPIIINGSYDNTPSRRRWMINQLKEWDPEGKGDVYLGVFTNGVTHDPRLHKLWHQLIPIPKTIRISSENQPFGAREGICLGEIEKLGSSWIINDTMLVQEAVTALQKALPGAPLYAINQYGNQDTPSIPSVTTIAYKENDFLPWLGSLRLYISLVGHETFSMVPAEAQSVGTPVIYRDMPQSLTEHIGHTGFMFRSVDELVMAARALYLCETRWEQMRLAGIRNAKARSIEHVGTMLDLALRRALCKGDIIW